MKKCIIISGGQFHPLPYVLRDLLSKPETTYDRRNGDLQIYACDRGVEYAYRWGIMPDQIYGDFDSYDEDGPAMRYMKDRGVPVHVSPVRKDDTDTLLAVREALSKGFTHIVICCGLGGRTDHLLANIQVMRYVASQGAICEMLTDMERLFTITENSGIVTLRREDGLWSNLSILALTENVYGLNIQGSDYDGEYDIGYLHPIGHGNRIAGDEASVSVRSGIALVIQS